MSQSGVTQPQGWHNDEIDLRALVIALWQGRWLVTGVTAVVFVLALAYLFLIPQTYKVSIEIKPIDSFDEALYKPLFDSTMLAVDAKRLSNFFFEDAQSMLADNIVKLNYIEKQADETSKEFIRRVGRVVSEFEFFAPSVDPKNENKQVDGVLNFTTKNLVLSQQLIAQTFADINAQVKTKLHTQFAFNIDHYRTELDDQLEDINIQIAAYEQAYQTKLGQDIAYLKEQAHIARSLNMAENQLLKGIQGNNDTVLLANQSMSSYLNGYIALEREIDLLESRSEPRLFVPELSKLLADQYNLNHDKTIQRAEKLYQQTPLASDDFSAVHYQMAFLDIQSKTKPLLVLVLAIILGGMLGVMVLVLRNTIKGSEATA